MQKCATIKRKLDVDMYECYIVENMFAVLSF